MYLAADVSILGDAGITIVIGFTVVFLVLLLFIWNRLRGRNTVTVFRRSVPEGKVLDAMTIVGIVIALAVAGAVVVSATSPIGFTDALYETVSALATVGTTTGATGKLSLVAKILIIIYMYFGRVGVLTISLGFLMGDKAEDRFRYAAIRMIFVVLDDDDGLFIHHQLFGKGAGCHMAGEELFGHGLPEFLFVHKQFLFRGFSLLYHGVHQLSMLISV